MTRNEQSLARVIRAIRPNAIRVIVECTDDEMIYADIDNVTYIFEIGSDDDMIILTHDDDVITFSIPADFGTE